MRKLIRLTNPDFQYIIVDDSAVKAGEWCIEMHNGQSLAEDKDYYIDSNLNKWWVRKMNMNCSTNDPRCKKITHSTAIFEFPFGNPYKELNLSKIDILTKGYCVGDLTNAYVTEQYAKERFLDVNAAFDSFLRGFVACEKIYETKFPSKKEWNVEIINDEITLL